MHWTLERSRNTCPICGALPSQPATNSLQTAVCGSCGTVLWCFTTGAATWYYHYNPVTLALHCEHRRATLPPDFSEKLTNDEFLIKVMQTGLLTRGQVSALLGPVSDPKSGLKGLDSAELAMELINAGALTAWQCQLIQQDRLQGFVTPPYRVVDGFYDGATCRVYKAKIAGTATDAVLKNAISPRAAPYLERELRSVNEVNSPFVVAVREATTLVVPNNPHFLVREYFHGCRLNTLVKNVGPLPPELTAHIMAQAASALSAFHEHGFVYRRLVPRKIIVDASANVKIMGTGMVAIPGVETPGADQKILRRGAYTSPQQRVVGATTDTWSDIYSLGACLYFCLAGTDPSGRTPLRAQIERLASEVAGADSALPELRSIMRFCVSANTNNGLTAHELSVQLRSVANAP